MEDIPEFWRTARHPEPEQILTEVQNLGAQTPIFNTEQGVLERLNICPCMLDEYSIHESHEHGLVKQFIQADSLPLEWLTQATINNFVSTLPHYLDTPIVSDLSHIDTRISYEDTSTASILATTKSETKEAAYQLLFEPVEAQPISRQQESTVDFGTREELLDKIQRRDIELKPYIIGMRGGCVIARTKESAPIQATVLYRVTDIDDHWVEYLHTPPIDYVLDEITRPRTLIKSPADFTEYICSQLQGEKITLGQVEDQMMKKTGNAICGPRLLCQFSDLEWAKGYQPLTGSAIYNLQSFIGYFIKQEALNQMVSTIDDPKLPSPKEALREVDPKCYEYTGDTITLPVYTCGTGEQSGYKPEHISQEQADYLVEFEATNYKRDRSTQMRFGSSSAELDREEINRTIVAGNKGRELSDHPLTEFTGHSLVPFLTDLQLSLQQPELELQVNGLPEKHNVRGIEYGNPTVKPVN